jgi:hypothetical protein
MIALRGKDSPAPSPLAAQRVAESPTGEPRPVAARPHARDRAE